MFGRRRTSRDRSQGVWWPSSIHHHSLHGGISVQVAKYPVSFLHRSEKKPLNPHVSTVVHEVNKLSYKSAIYAPCTGAAHGSP